MAQVRDNKQMTTAKETAKKYVDEQLEVLKRHGSLTRLSKTTYESIVNQVVRVTK
jgi:hypothetical protein